MGQSAPGRPAEKVVHDLVEGRSGSAASPRSLFPALLLPSTALEALERRLEGGEELRPAVAGATAAFGHRERVERAAREGVAAAARSLQGAAAVEECLAGLGLDFAAVVARLRRVDLPGIQRDSLLVVVVFFHGGTVPLPEGPPRVTTARGFLYVQTLLQELSAACAMIQGGGACTSSSSQREEEVEGEEETCPICMDRAIDTVLSCSHGLCKVCEIEWLVGEGRGTCPICRRRERESEDWVLHSSNRVLDPNELSNVRDRLENVRIALLSFLLSLPCVNECSSSLWFDETSPMLDTEGLHDGIHHWLKAQLAFRSTMDKDCHWTKCPRCTTLIRIPLVADDDVRMNCGGCRMIVSVDVLLNDKVRNC